MLPMTEEELGPVIAASAAALILLRGTLEPQSWMGGHFEYHGEKRGQLTGRAAMATALVCGVSGAMVGTIFHKLVHILKDIAWKKRIVSTSYDVGKTQPCTSSNNGGILSLVFNRNVSWLDFAKGVCNAPSRGKTQPSQPRNTDYPAH